MGRPVLQLPEDLIRMQELIFQLKPDFVIECGIAFGGALLYYASVLQSIGKGRAIGIDIDIKAVNRKAIEENPLSSLITLIESSSTDPQTLEKVKTMVSGTLLVILDSNHSKAHVLRELELFSKLVPSGSYIVVADGFKKELADVPRGKKEWEWDNPSDATEEFLASNSDFIIDPPKRLYNRTSVGENVSHFSSNAFLRRK